MPATVRQVRVSCLSGVSVSGAGPAGEFLEHLVGDVGELDLAGLADRPEPRECFVAELHRQ